MVRAPKRLVGTHKHAVTGWRHSFRCTYLVDKQLRVAAYSLSVDSRGRAPCTLQGTVSFGAGTDPNEVLVMEIYRVIDAIDFPSS